MKKLILGLLLATTSLTTMAQNTEVVYGNTGRYCPGSTITMNTNGDYVEKVLISAEGIRDDGFVKVYADGQLIFNVGVPGYDPDYSFRVRQNVEELTFKFERTCVKVLDLKAYTKVDGHRNGRGSSTGYNYNFALDSWGSSLVDIVNSVAMGDFGPAIMGEGLWADFFMPTKKLGLKHMALVSARDERSIDSAYVALKFSQLYFENEEKIEKYMGMQNLDELMVTLMTINQEILEAYDVDKDSLESVIADLETDL